MSCNPCKLNLLAFLDLITDKYLYIKNNLLTSMTPVQTIHPAHQKTTAQTTHNCHLSKV